MTKKEERLKRTSFMLGCDTHNYILIKKGETFKTYKCSKCRDILRLSNDNICCKCKNSCKRNIKRTETEIKCDNFIKQDNS